MKILIAVAVLIGLAGCSRPQAVTYHNVNIHSNLAWPLGEARTCMLVEPSSDGMRMACPAYDPDDPENFEKVQYLVTADFAAPVHYDHTGSGVYGLTCRLDSFAHATCDGGIHDDGR